METMFLVVGLAVVGLAGIVAAFYFSNRSGKRGGQRLRAAGTGRVAANRAGAAGRPPSQPVRTGQTEFALRASGPRRIVRDSRGPGTRAGALTESWPSSPADPEDFQPADAWPGDTADTDPGLRAADPGPRAARADTDPFRDDRPRRRVGFRKGADVDEELWPADSFGGVSDEQFWDDLASDKPLTTTARTAQQEAGPRSRRLGNGPAANAPGRRAAGGGAYPGARPAPEPAAERATAQHTTAQHTTGQHTTGQHTTTERTAIQPTYAATQPVKSMTPPAPGAPQSFQYPSQTTKPTPPPQAAKPAQPATAATPPPGMPQPVRAAGTGPASQPRGASAPPTEGGRRRRPSSADDDPLTSAAFSLRQRGPVDGRSTHRPRDQRDAPRDQRDASRERTDAASGSGRGPASPYGHTAPYGSSGTSYDDASSATQMMVTPPYGQNYGYGTSPEAQPDLPTEPRRQNGTRSHARPGAPDGRPQPARPGYPQDTRPASGSYPAGGAYGAYPANGNQPGGHQGNGPRGNGHRAPYDPRDDYRRLTHQR
jgi:hypothetical protein